MKPRELHGEGATPDGATVTLHREAESWVVRVGREVLMSSRAHGSEEEMASLALARLATERAPRVLVGGLGMGFTLRACLDRLPRGAVVEVAELLECVVEWNRGPLSALSGSALDDPRVRLHVGDVRDTLAPAAWDAILLDVDNGPEAFTTAANGALYSPAGLADLRASLAPRGVLAVWSAFPSRPFERALTKALFTWEAKTVRARADSSRGARHTVFLARPRVEGPGGASVSPTSRRGSPGER